MIVLIKPTFFGVLDAHVLLVRVLPVRVLLVRVLLVNVLKVQSSPLNTVGRGGVTILKECGKKIWLIFPYAKHNLIYFIYF